MLKALSPPTAYQGGKSRIAKLIIPFLLAEAKDYYYDLCCGSGAISLELVANGVSPKNITMVDQGPWGLFWQEIGCGSFDLEKFKSYIEAIPKDPSLIKSHVEKLAKQDPSIDTTSVFLILQASSFGSKPIWYHGNSWKNCSFRSYWKPTSTSNRRSPVNPMMPMPETLLKRVSFLAERMKGVNGINSDLNTLGPIRKNSTIYIDPPYLETTPYGFQLDVVSYVSKLGRKCFVSEGKALNPSAVLLATSQDRAKGGISGNKSKTSNSEYLNILESC